MNTAADLIARSTRTTTIVHAAYDADLAAELELECDDSADTPDVSEYWGTDEDGEEWRVHLDK